jgi:hypothetical protein
MMLAPRTTSSAVPYGSLLVFSPMKSVKSNSRYRYVETISSLNKEKRLSEGEASGRPPKIMH